jgi:K(+)-stimulated pyrophosphate-energized sodium pump
VSVVQGWVYFFLAASGLSLAVALLFTRKAMAASNGAPVKLEIARRLMQAKASFQRRYKTAAAILALLLPTFAYAQPEHAVGGEANLVLPDLSTVQFFGINGHALLMIGLLFCVGGLLFGLTIYVQLKNSPVHRTML